MGLPARISMLGRHAGARPRREVSIRLFACEGCQEPRIFVDIWNVVGEVADQSQKGTNVACLRSDKPVEYASDLVSSASTPVN